MVPMLTECRLVLTGARCPYHACRAAAQPLPEHARRLRDCRREADAVDLVQAGAATSTRLTVPTILLLVGVDSECMPGCATVTVARWPARAPRSMDIMKDGINDLINDRYVASACIMRCSRTPSKATFVSESGTSDPAPHITALPPPDMRRVVCANLVDCPRPRRCGTSTAPRTLTTCPSPTTSPTTSTPCRSAPALSS